VGDPGASGPAERRLKKPTGIAAIVAACGAGSLSVAHVIGVTGPALDALFIVSSCAIVAIPVAFLVAVLRRYLSRTALVTMLPKVTSSPSTAQIASALRESLKDPDLQVLYWSDTEGSYIGEDGQPVVDPSGKQQKLVVEIRTRQDAPVAAIVADAAVGLDPDFVKAAAAAVGQSMENARLLETVREQFSELKQATGRVMEASAAERTRIQRDLHDGVQGQLAGLALRLGAAIAQTPDSAIAARLREIRSGITDAVAEIRRLAAGIRPAALSLGLAAAVSDLCGQHSLDATVDLPDDGLTEGVQEAVYLAISEAVTNIVKHAQAQTAQICGRMEDGALVIVVADDGTGGAAVGEGTGLRSIRDRVAALNGQVQISSRVGRGTQITMRIPCA
jgi:signal transduction histidine kinase